MEGIRLNLTFPDDGGPIRGYEIVGTSPDAPGPWKMETIFATEKTVEEIGGITSSSLFVIQQRHYNRTYDFYGRLFNTGPSGRQYGDESNHIIIEIGDGAPSPPAPGPEKELPGALTLSW